MSANRTDRCVCGHPKVAHEHLRRGSDCALCNRGCPRFRPDGRDHEPLASRVRSALHLSRA